MGQRRTPRVGIASNGLGRAPAGHTLETKFKAAQQNGFEGIELAWECLEYHAKAFETGSTSKAEAMHAAAHDVKKLAASHSLILFALQPFAGYDALVPGDRLEHRFKDGLLWLECCKIMSIQIMQVPTCLYPLTDKDINTDVEHIAKNMARLADAAQKYGVTLGYEAPAWGIAMATWQGVQKVIDAAKRPNIKHCLDTYHISGYIAGDPKNTNGNWLIANAEAAVKADADELGRSLRAEDIAYFQLSDAEEIDLSQKNYVAPDLNQPFHMTWSRNCRPFPYEGLLPLIDTVKAVLDTGYNGWISMEVFHTQLSGKDPRIPYEWAERGMKSWKRIAQECGV